MESIAYSPKRDWESLFASWIKPSSETEVSRSKNAERMVGDALKEYAPLKYRNYRVFATGSYANNTNVRLNSDVDIMVCCTDTSFYNLPEGYTISSIGISPATYHFEEFKNDVQAALSNKFGYTEVKRGNKVLVISENSYRVGTDVCPCFEYNQSELVYGRLNPWPTGVQFITDDGWAIQNWPQQHLDNGIEKNNQTNYRYKYLVRILKRLRNEMVDHGYKEAEAVPPLLIECMAWNVPNNWYFQNSYKETVRLVLAYLITEIPKGDPERWREVNGIKFLFHWRQKWTQQQALDFLLAAWNYAEC